MPASCPHPPWYGPTIILHHWVPRTPDTLGLETFKEEMSPFPCVKWGNGGPGLSGILHNTFAYRDPIYAAWIIALPRPLGKFYSFRSLIVIFLFWIRRKGHIADFWFQDDESFMNYPQSCSFLFPVSCCLWHRAVVFLSSVVMETATVEWTAYWGTLRLRLSPVTPLLCLPHWHLPRYGFFASPPCLGTWPWSCL